MKLGSALPSIVSEYECINARIGGHEVKVVSYRLGDRYVCGIDSADPGATICRTTGGTRRIAHERALLQAATQLRNHGVSGKDAPSSQAVVVDRLVVGGDKEQTYRVSDFVKLPLAERMSHILGGRVKFLDAEGAVVSPGEALRFLKRATESGAFVA